MVLDKAMPQGDRPSPDFSKEKSPSPKHGGGVQSILFLLLLASCWGPSFLFIKLSVPELGPFLLVASRLTLGAILLAPIVLWKRLSLYRTPRQLLDLTVMAFFSTALPFSLISAGEQSIDSSLAAMVNSTTPFFTVLLCIWWLPGERIVGKQIGAVVLGFLGIGFIFLPKLMEIERSPDLWGAFLVLMAAISYAVAMVYARLRLAGQMNLASVAIQLMLAGLMIWPLALSFNSPAHVAMLSKQAILGVCGLSVFGTALAFWAYYRLIEIAGPLYLSMSTLLFPVFGVILGVIFLSESPQPNAYFGSAIILVALALMNGLLVFPSHIGNLLQQFAQRYRS